MSIDDILTKNNISELNTVIITCVDPHYPVSSLGKDLEHIDVRYTPGDHVLGGHVQIAGKGWTQVAFDSQYNILALNEVNPNLGEGVVQLSYNPSSKDLVMGIPGDVAAFKLGARGFAFGKDYHKHATPTKAYEILGALLDRTAPDAKIIAMKHPDCGAYANGPGKYDSEVIEAGREVTPENFMESEYHLHHESPDKDGAIMDIKLLLAAKRMSNFEIRVPEYSPRTPGIYNVHHGGQH